MNNHAKVFAVALVTFWSFPLLAQGTPVAGQSVPATQPAAPAGSAAPVSTADLRPVDGELLHKLDSKTAKNGDSVVVKTEEPIKAADGTVIPKGSKLVGRVTGVQPHSKTSMNSSLAIQFDHAQLKSGKSVEIASVIKSVAPPEGSSPAGGPEAMPGGGGMSTMGGGSAGGGSGPGGGAAGGMAQPSPGQGPMMSQANSGPAPGTVVAHQGSIAIRTTSVPGVLVANNENGLPMPNASGLLLGARQNIHLDGGTRIVLAVAPSGAGAN